jgi:Uma2 family endonuclease
MATAVETKATRALHGEHRFLLRGVGWEGYEALLGMVGDANIRITYDRGDAELMSPLIHHEHSKKMIVRLIEALTEEMNLPCEGAGATTFRKPLLDRGLEPDECYYLAHATLMFGRRTLDLSVDPPPDLALEIAITKSALDRMGIYAALAIPEVWRFDGETLAIECLQADGSYQSVAVSPQLPLLTPTEVIRWVELGQKVGQTAAIRRFRAWVRKKCNPRRKKQ